MALSVGGMILAAAGWVTPVEGAVAQEVIDVAAVLNALRAAVPPRRIYDMNGSENSYESRAPSRRASFVRFYLASRARRSASFFTGPRSAHRMTMMPGDRKDQ